MRGNRATRNARGVVHPHISPAGAAARANCLDLLATMWQERFRLIQMAADAFGNRG
jgi:hypothetical protein